MRKRFRLAAIDVGSNSIHMIVVEDRGRTYRVIDKEKEMVQLARGSLGGQPLNKAAIERGVAAMQKMAGIAERWEVDQIVAVATSAVREAPNRRSFIHAAEAASGIKIRVISGEEEADYIYRAVRSAVDFHGGTALVMDIGGGSLEMIVGTSDEVFFTSSHPLGAIRMTEQFLRSDPPAAKELVALRRHVRARLDANSAEILGVGFDFCVGTSGTITTLAELASGGETIPSSLRVLERERLEALIVRLASVTAEERAKRFGIDPKRAMSIVAGAVVIDEVLEVLGVEKLQACPAALREGVVEKVLDERHGTAVRRGSVRREAVLALAEHAEVDRPHAEQVAKLAVRIFDQTRELHGLRNVEREMLEHAAMLHEVGLHVAFQGHHRHSYYIIRHAGLKGFSDDQVAIVANVARYYRKAAPDEADENFAVLTASQREVVRKLSAILRIAAGLDRGHQQAVRDVAVDVDKTRVTFRLRCRLDAAVEVEAAAKRAKYFSKLFERKVSIESGE